MRYGGALARFGLEFVAVLLGFDAPEQEYALRGALADRDDGAVANQVEVLARKHRRVYADHRRLVEPALQLLRGGPVDERAVRLVAVTALHALRSTPGSFRLGPFARPVSTGIEAAFLAAQAEDPAGVRKALVQIPEAEVSPSLSAVLRGVGEAFGGAEILEPLPLAARRSTPPAGFDLDRGRQSRADLVTAVLRAHDVQIKDVERGRVRIITRDDLVEAILRDPFWDDIDASTQEDGVVDGILHQGRPSPSIDLSGHGHRQVTITRIVR